MGDKPPIDTQIVKSEPQASAVQEPTALEQVSENLACLRPKEDALVTIFARGITDVLPAKFYEGASELKLTPEELVKLSQFADAPDDIITIRSDGQVYVEHIHYRRALTDLFGTEWAMLPGTAGGSPRDKYGNIERPIFYQRWTLVVRGKFVYESVGAATYFESESNWSDKSDTTETAVAIAIRRCCAKSSLGIYSNLWDRRFITSWKKRCAVQVWATQKNQRVRWWRRIDDDPFEGEIGPVVKEQPKFDKISPKGQAQEPKGSVGPEESRDSSIPGVVTGAGSDRRESGPQVPAPLSQDPEKPPKVTPQPMTTEPATPAASQPQGVEMVNEGNFRVFIMDSRRRKLVEGENTLQAIGWICQTLNKPAPTPKVGEKQMVTLRDLFKTLTRQEFNDVLLPKLREKG